MLNLINYFKMKKIIYIAIAFSLAACEKFDHVADLAQVGQFAPNVYMSPIAPVASPNSEVELNIQYWSPDEKFNELALWQGIDTSAKIEITLAPDSLEYIYTYNYTGTRDSSAVYKTYDFDFADWTPDLNAYNRKPKYPVNASLAKFSKANSATNTPTVFSGFIPEKVKTDMYTYLAGNLKKAQLTNLLVNTHAVINSTDVESQYETDGKLKAGAVDYFAAKIAGIGFVKLLGTKYKYERTNNVSLQFKVTNGYNQVGSSATRSFNVQ